MKFYGTFFEKKLYIYVWEGLKWTLALTAIAAVIGLIIGLIVATIQIAPFPKKLKFLEKILKRLAVIYVDVIRGTPAIVQVAFMYSVVFTSPNVSKLFIGGLAFGINSGAYMSELVRAGIQGIDKGQMEAGRSLGIGYPATMRYIILPQAFKNVLPALVSEFVILIKETAVIGFIGGTDLMRSADTMTSITFNASQPLLIVAVIYLILTSTFTRLMRKVEKKVRLGD
ncbi:MAG: amino acid ABC transporter permease [Epulopiscium sp.]|nr:amino acid ABC transporter permease [Candidatus Epulonipiscium sp.]